MKTLHKKRSIWLLLILSTTLAIAGFTLAQVVNKIIMITNDDIPLSLSGNEKGQLPQIDPPLINIIKILEPQALTSKQGLVTYTYQVTNQGIVVLRNVSVSNDNYIPVRYVSGDENTDNLLQFNETWIFTSQMNFIEATTNTTTAKGSANGMITTDIAFATDGQIPKTYQYELFLLGAALTLGGAVCWRSRKQL